MWLPPAVQAQSYVDRLEPWVRNFNSALHELDRHLSLAFFSEDTEPVYGITPGRWHVVYRREQTVAFFPIVNTDGGYMEPHYGVIEQLRSNDLWKDKAMKQMKERQEHERREHEKDLEREREGFCDEARIVANAIVSPYVLFSDDVKWANSAKGNRGRAG